MKFKFNDKVEVISGFYLGQIATVINYYVERKLFRKSQIIYCIRIPEATYQTIDHKRV